MMKSLIFTLSLFCIHASSLCARLSANLKPTINALSHAREAEKKYGIPENLLTAIAYVESKHSPYAVNAKGRGFYFKTKEQAAQFIRTMQKQGVDANIGYMQLNLRSHRGRFKSIEDMLELRNNIDFAAKLLCNLHRRYGSWPRAVERYKSRFCAGSKRYQNMVFSLRGRVPKGPSVPTRDYQLVKAEKKVDKKLAKKLDRHTITSYRGSFHVMYKNLAFVLPKQVTVAGAKTAASEDPSKAKNGSNLFVTMKEIVHHSKLNLPLWRQTSYASSEEDMVVKENTPLASQGSINTKTHPKQGIISFAI